MDKISPHNLIVAQDEALMVRSASSRVSNHGHGEAGMIGANRKML
jgi:hypothetical protein